MTYQTALSYIDTSKKYGAQLPDTDSMTEEEVIQLAEEKLRYDDALEAEATGN